MPRASGSRLRGPPLCRDVSVTSAHRYPAPLSHIHFPRPSTLGARMQKSPSRARCFAPERSGDFQHPPRALLRVGRRGHGGSQPVAPSEERREDAYLSRRQNAHVSALPLLIPRPHAHFMPCSWTFFLDSMLLFSWIGILESQPALFLRPGG